MKPYSPKKSKTKGTEENSVLNPLTNSDSPSVKSNGARFVSAKIVHNHGKINGHNKKKLSIKK